MPQIVQHNKNDEKKSSNRSWRPAYETNSQSFQLRFFPFGPLHEIWSLSKPLQIRKCHTCTQHISPGES